MPGEVPAPAIACPGQGHGAPLFPLLLSQEQIRAEEITRRARGRRAAAVLVIAGLAGFAAVLGAAIALGS